VSLLASVSVGSKNLFRILQPPAFTCRMFYFAFASCQCRTSNVKNTFDQESFEKNKAVLRGQAFHEDSVGRRVRLSYGPASKQISAESFGSPASFLKAWRLVIPL